MSVTIMGSATLSMEESFGIDSYSKYNAYMLALHYTFMYLAFNNNSVTIQGCPPNDEQGTADEAVTFFGHQLSVI